MNQMTEAATIEIINIVTTATRCSCGCAVSVMDDGPMPHYTSRWAAFCAECSGAGVYQGIKGTDDRAHVIGRGASMDEALWAWQDAHDAAWQVEWRLVDPPGVQLERQVNEEAERQRGWVVHPVATGREYIPRYWQPALP